MRSVFAGGYVANGLTLGADGGALGPEVAVGVDLQFYAAVAEDAFRDYGDHVDARNFGGNDKGRGLVVGISGAGADRRHESLRVADQGAVPLVTFFEKGDQ